MLRVCLILLVASICLLSSESVDPVGQLDERRLRGESTSMQGLRGDASPFAGTHESL